MLTDDEAEKADRVRVFMLNDRDAVKKYIAFCNKHSRDIKACRKEVTERYGREPALFSSRTFVYMEGLKINPEKWYETERARMKAEAEAADETYGYRSVKNAPIPEGWRKRVKDDFLCPPLKGGGEAAQIARDLCKKYDKLENQRGYMKRVHGIKPLVFAGLSMVTVGIDSVGAKGSEVIYVKSRGPEQNVKDLILMTEVKHSAYLAAKGE